MTAPKKRQKQSQTWGQRARTRVSAGFNKLADNQPSWATGLAVLFIVVSPVVSYGVGHARGKWVWLLLVTQALIAFLIWFIPYLQKRRAEGSELRLRTEVRATITDFMDPLMEEIASLANSSRAGMAGQRERIQSMVLASAASALGGPRARANFYVYRRRLRAATSTRSGESVVWLEHVQSAGRGASRARFTTSDEAGRFTIDTVIRQHAQIFIHDVTTDPPPGWDPSRKKYKTFIAVPVRAKGRMLGMLTVDSMSPGELTEEDCELLGVFAWILAAALTWGDRMEAVAPHTAAPRRFSPPTSPDLPEGETER